MSIKRLRDEFAMAALTGLLSSESCPNESMGSSYISYTAEQAARISYNIADAMLEEREASEIRKVQARRRQQQEEERARDDKYRQGGSHYFPL